MSSNGIGNVAPVRSGRGKVHILDDYVDEGRGTSYPSNTRCGKSCEEWDRLPDQHCLVFMDSPKSCSVCVRMLGDD